MKLAYLKQLGRGGYIVMNSLKLINPNHLKQPVFEYNLKTAKQPWDSPF